jgi:hypothetical protein
VRQSVTGWEFVVKGRVYDPARKCPGVHPLLTLMNFDLIVSLLKVE